MGYVFTPIIATRTMIAITENSLYTQEEKEYLEGLGARIYEDAKAALLEAVKEKQCSIVLTLTEDSPLVLKYNYNPSLYSYLGLWKAIKNCSQKDDLIFYEIGLGNSILTY